VLVPLDTALREALQLTAFQGQAAIALYVLGLAVGQPLAGWGADRWGRRRTLLAGLFIGLCGSAMAAAATNATILLAGRCLTGLGLSVVLVVPRATLRDLCSGAPLQRGMAIISVAFAFTPAVAPVLGWWLLAHGGGWRVALGVVPLLVALGGAVALGRHVETRPAGTTLPGWDTLPALWQHRTPRWVAIGFAAISSVFFLLIAQGPAALRESVGLDGREIAWVLGGTYLGFLVGSPVGHAPVAAHRCAGPVPRGRRAGGAGRGDDRCLRVVALHADVDPGHAGLFDRPRPDLPVGTQRGDAGAARARRHGSGLHRHAADGGGRAGEWRCCTAAGPCHTTHRHGCLVDGGRRRRGAARGPAQRPHLRPETRSKTLNNKDIP
jgi:hypothetical protein